MTARVRISDTRCSTVRRGRLRLANTTGKRARLPESADYAIRSISRDFLQPALTLNRSFRITLSARSMCTIYATRKPKRRIINNAFSKSLRIESVEGFGITEPKHYDSRYFKAHTHIETNQPSFGNVAGLASRLPGPRAPGRRVTISSTRLWNRLPSLLQLQLLLFLFSLSSYTYIYTYMNGRAQFVVRALRNVISVTQRRGRIGTRRRASS